MYRLYFKAILDFGLVFFVIIFLLPIFFIIWLLVFFKLGKPVLFSQKRPGKNGNVFHIYKFRTMTDKRDALGNMLPDNERLTNFGLFLRKTSLDELPQLFNVLKGDLSLVGPRPLLVEYLSLYNEEQKKRHDVKPGITGLAQVNGRNAITWKQKFEYDVWYVDHVSLKLDLKILFLTLHKAVKHEGVNKEGQATTVAFNGNN